MPSPCPPLTRRPVAEASVRMSLPVATTNIPMLHTQGFWAMAHEARTDWCMFLGALFLLVVGPGAWSIDSRVTSHR
jgi:putative oxidoreductase